MLPQPRTTEKTKAVLGQAQTPVPKNDPEPVKGHGRNGASSYTGAKRIAVPHPTLQAGDPCPGCEKGKVYLQKQPRVLVRMVGQAPVAATVYELDRLRCNLCGESVHGAGTGRHRPGKIRRNDCGHDRATQVRQRHAVLPIGKAGAVIGHSVAGLDPVGDRRRSRGSDPSCAR
jgi:hypothetical protein